MQVPANTFREPIFSVFKFSNLLYSEEACQEEDRPIYILTVRYLVRSLYDIWIKMLESRQNHEFLCFCFG